MKMHSYRHKSICSIITPDLIRDAKFSCQALSTVSGGETLTILVSVFKYNDLDHLISMGSFSTN